MGDLVAGCYPPPYYVRCMSTDSVVVEQCEYGERLDEVLQRCVMPTTDLWSTLDTMSTILPDDDDDDDDDDDSDYSDYF